MSRIGLPSKNPLQCAHPQSESLQVAYALRADVGLGVGSYTFTANQRLLLAVVAVGVRAAAVARVDVAGGGHVEGAGEVVARALAVELAGAEVDVRGAVAVHPRLGLKAVGAGVAGVESDGLKDGEHCVTQSSRT